MYESIHNLLHREPFKLFQVRLTNGKSMPIRDPKTVIMLKSRIIVCFPQANRFDFFDTPEIVEIDLLQRGQRKK